MRVLLDEWLPLDFRGHEAHTAEWAGVKGKKNGELLEAAGYEVLLTVDQGIPHQVRPTTRTIAIVVLRSPTNQLEDLRMLARTVLEILGSIKPGQTIAIGPCN